jgi:hypothetical protein
MTNATQAQRALRLSFIALYSPRKRRCLFNDARSVNSDLRLIALPSSSSLPIENENH